MKRVTKAFIPLACVLILCGCHTPPKSTVWEYKQINAHLSDKQFNDYAKQGWVVDQIVKGRTENNEWIYILLKRPVP